MPTYIAREYMNACTHACMQTYTLTYTHHSFTFLLHALFCGARSENPSFPWPLSTSSFKAAVFLDLAAKESEPMAWSQSKDILKPLAVYWRGHTRHVFWSHIPNGAIVSGTSSIPQRYFKMIKVILEDLYLHHASRMPLVSG